MRPSPLFRPGSGTRGQGRQGRAAAVCGGLRERGSARADPALRRIGKSSRSRVSRLAEKRRQGRRAAVFRGLRERHQRPRIPLCGESDVEPEVVEIDGRGWRRRGDKAAERPSSGVCASGIRASGSRSAENRMSSRRSSRSTVAAGGDEATRPHSGRLQGFARAGSARADPALRRIKCRAGGPRGRGRG